MLNRRLTKFRNRIIYEAWQDYVKGLETGEALTVEDLAEIFSDNISSKSIYRVIKEEK